MRRGRVRLAATLSLAGTIWSPEPAGCLQIILNSKPDTRKTFVIGIPLIFGLSLQGLPELYAQIIPWLHPLFGSALTLATVLAVVLNVLLRIGETEGEPTTNGH